ncbi:MAG: efflux transporter periplasmic adaptor subunit, partial [Muribaculaceae bacterium]|nr:efflux transporter periplasmic adaptor subunit [Muribaculaceae bacterium]
VVSVPERIIEYSNDSTFVYLLTSGDDKHQTFKKVAVETGLSNGIDVALLGPATITTDSKLRGNKAD